MMNRLRLLMFGAVILTLGLLVPLSSVRHSNAKEISPLDRPLTKSVRGALVKGLAPSDLRLIKKESKKNRVDYRLVLALIHQESRFQHDAVSERGATGLMQVMPVTHAAVSEELQLEDPTVPEANIKVGVYYFSQLLELFKDASPENQVALALAAYNAGPGRVYDAQALAAFLGEDPQEWSSIQRLLPLLSKRYYSLHSHVWDNARPPCGYFGSWRQTVSYVNKVTATYQKYQSMM